MHVKKIVFFFSKVVKAFSLLGFCSSPLWLFWSCSYSICESLRRIISKAVLSAICYDILSTTGSLQLCTGQTAGVESALHDVKQIYRDPSTECALQVDAINAFNSLNQSSALHNIHHLCPELATIIINCYREPVDLFMGSPTSLSPEGTTQGDPLATPFYALAAIPLIKTLSSHNHIRQVWYTNDAAALGKTLDVQQWGRTP